MEGFRAISVALRRDLKRIKGLGTLSLLALSQDLKPIKQCLEYFILTVVAAGPLPQHVAIILDGNRRFAKQRRLEKNAGHVFGVENVARTFRYFQLLGVKYVTVYAFSVENFRRPKDEVDALMEMLRQQLENIAENGDIAGLAGIRVRLVGNLKMLPEKVLQAANRAIEATARNDRFVLNICVAFSTSDEIVTAVERSCGRLLFGGEDDEIDVKRIEEDLFTAGLPEPDILIRTAGETRLSNFMLWQAGFCYLHASPVFWPEFSLWHLVYAVLCYQRVEKSLQSFRRKYVAENTVCIGKPHA